MYEGNLVRLRLENSMNGSKNMEGMVHECQVLSYEDDKDRLVMLLRKGDLSSIQLSAKYECVIFDETKGLRCSGEVEKRYRGEKGNIIEFYIKNGFYKINLNSVDK